MIPWLDSNTPFPDVASALTEVDGAAGLLAAGADLSTARLLDAYRHGIFPWFSEGQPILWWSTNPRMILITDQIKISTSLKKILRKIEYSNFSGGPWQIKFDSAFANVIYACAAPRNNASGTWISQQIIDAYIGLHKIGYAHSSEVWLNGELVGGAYGVSIGRMFFGESMFAHVSNMSKVALAYLIGFLHQQQVAIVDCQQQTSHLSSLGAVSITRDEFILHLKKAVSEPAIENWSPVKLFKN